MTSAILHLHDIHEYHPGLTPVIAAHLLEGCVVTLHRKTYRDGQALQLEGDHEQVLLLSWSAAVDQRTEDAWADQDYATEHGAVCLAVLLTYHLTGKKVIRRAVKKSGVDYWVGDVKAGLFVGLARLEVSGLFTGTTGQFKRRFRDKLKQTSQSDATGLPAFVSITEFHQLRSLFSQKK
jgi:hypothetical protein